MSRQQVERPVVLHIVEKFDTGVGAAIEAIVDTVPEFKHVIAACHGGENVQDVEIFPLPGAHVAAALEVRRLVRQMSPDIVHAHSSFGGLYSRWFRWARPRVFQPHCYSFERLSSPAILRVAFVAIERLLARRSDVTIAVGSYEAKLARELTKAREVVVVPNSPSVCSRTTPDMTSREQEGNNPIVIVGSGRICAQKDPALFADVARLVRATRPEIQFCWLGGGDPVFRDRLVDSGVFVTGWLTSEGVRDKLSTASCFLHTAAWEGFPVSVLDAASFGLPVVGRDIGPLRHEGLATFPDAQTLAAAVLECVDSPGSRTKLVALSNELVSRMCRERQQAEIRAIYAKQLQEVRAA